MNIYASIIVKDNSEVAQLARAIDSVKRYVDGVYVTATGEKVDTIKQMCEANDINYSYFKWEDDFSNVRNFNFSQVPDNADYIFWLDSDDLLVNGQYLRELAEVCKQNGKDVVFLEYWYACRFKGEPSVENIDKVQLVHQRERLIRPGTIHWQGRLHETPIPNDNVKHTYTGVPYKEPHVQGQQYPVAVAHMATDAGLKEKMERNRSILELQLKEEKEKGEADPRTLLYLMKIYTETGTQEDNKWEDTLQMGEEYLKKSGWDEERGTCWELMGQIWGHKGDFRKSVECFSNAIREWPHNILPYLRLASAYYNLQDFKNARHWLEVGSKMDMDKKFTSGMTNYYAIKAMFAELLVKLNFNVDKDINKAFDAATMLFQENPSEENRNQLVYMENAKYLNDACERLDKLTEYLYKIGEEKSIIPILDNVPQVMQDMPFAQKLRQKFTPPRHWEDNEICYFANFNQSHFYKWDSSSIDTGAGGSETAVIKLAEEWAKQGYKVTVYCDPVTNGIQNGVNYLPWYYFNIKDYFNIFIQWRGWQLSTIVKAKRFYSDLHDIYSAVDISANQLNNVDKFMVKSDYHRGLAPTVPDDKFMIIPHGL